MAAQSVEQPSPIISQIPTEVIRESRTFNEEEVRELLTSLSTSVVETSDDLDID